MVKASQLAHGRYWWLELSVVLGRLW